MSVEGSDEPYPGEVKDSSDQPARLRDQGGRQRDTAAARRDEHAARRDEAAAARDQDSHRRVGSYSPSDAAPGIDAQLAAMLRAADADRGYAHIDRVAAGNDRADAAIDRQEALADRMAAARDRRQASLDGLTGVYNREAGMVELNRDVARAARTGRQLVVAFLDVDHLKSINDRHGHAAGDRALIAVADTLTTVLRPYDLIIRCGGDEFLCAAEGIDIDAARSRFDHVNELLGSAEPRPGDHAVSITTGLAQLTAGETTDSVIGRADADLYQQRQRRHHNPEPTTDNR